MLKTLSIFANRQFQSIAISHLCTTLGNNIILPVLPVFLHLNGFTETQIGFIMGVTAASALVMRPTVGYQVDMHGSRPSIMLGQILIILSTIGYLVVSSFTAIFTLRLMFGIALAFYGTGAVTFASRIGSGSETANSIAMYTMITMLAIGLSMSFSQLTFDQFGFTTLIFTSVVLVSSSLLVMLFRARPIPPIAGGVHMPFSKVLKMKAVLGTTTCQFAGNFAFGALFTFIPLAALSKGIQFYSLFFISFAVFVVGSRFFIQAINNMLGMEKTALYSNGLMMISLLLLFANISPITLVISGALFGLGFGAVFPTLVLLLIQRIDPTNRGTALGILTAAGDIGNALAAAILGSVAEHFGYPPLFMTTFILLAICTVLFHNLLTGLKPQPEPEPTSK